MPRARDAQCCLLLQKVAPWLPSLRRPFREWWNVWSSTPRWLASHDRRTIRIAERSTRFLNGPRLVGVSRKRLLFGRLSAHRTLCIASLQRAISDRAHPPAPFGANGRYLADHVPDATYLELPGNAHFAPEGDSDAIVDAITRFSVADRSIADRPPAERFLATVLFTDIVGSAELASRVGDAAWRDLQQKFYTLGRNALDLHRGRQIDTAGDGLFATFDGPARAIRCAATMVKEAKEMGLVLRAGLHTGEVEPSGDKVSGMGVHIGARVMAQASPGEVLVSRTVRDLVAGSGIDFEPRGAHPLKGLPGEWPLHRALT